VAASAFRRLALIAGGGRFPFEIAERARARGLDIRVIALRGFADRGHSGAVVVDMLDPQRLIAELSAFQPDAVALAGAVIRPSLGVALSVFTAFRNRAEIARVFANGDDGLLVNAVGLIEQAGFRVVGVDEVAPELLMPEGQLGRHPMPSASLPAIETGRHLLLAISPFDVGQAVVIAGQRVLAVEGPEGTSAMLRRVRDLRRTGRVSRDREPAILVKFAKAGQDRRVDLPAVGPKTVEQARAAGIIGLALGARDVITIERQALIAAADRTGLFVVGVER
jgi:DUF1009 family protein